MTECRKQKHATRTAAEDHMYSLIRSGWAALKPRALHVYRCPCGSWHVGHVQVRPRAVR